MKKQNWYEWLKKKVLGLVRQRKIYGTMNNTKRLELQNESMKVTTSWEPMDDGKTISDAGCDGGIILKDEEMIGARITLEEGSIIAEFSITCGIYGLMVHTACAGTEKEALLMYDKMKEEIEWFMNQDFDDQQNSEWCEAFTNKY